MGQLEAKLWHSSGVDKIHSYYLYLVTEHVKASCHKIFHFYLLQIFLVPFCIHAAKFLKTCIVNYFTSYWLCDCCSKKYINEIIVCI